MGDVFVSLFVYCFIGMKAGKNLVTNRKMPIDSQVMFSLNYDSNVRNLITFQVVTTP